MQYRKARPKSTRHLLVQRNAFRITQAAITNVDEQVAKRITKLRLEQRAALARRTVEVLDHSLNAGSGKVGVSAEGTKHASDSAHALLAHVGRRRGNALQHAMVLPLRYCVLVKRMLVHELHGRAVLAQRGFH